MRYKEKSAEKSSKKEQLWFFYPLFFQIKDIYNATLSIQHVVLQDLQGDKVIDFSKGALHAGTARNKWLKYNLNMA